jgi:hypothetical protein
VEAAEAEAEAEAADAETVGNDGERVVTAVSRRQQRSMDDDGGDSLERMVSGEVSVVL